MFNSQVEEIKGRLDIVDIIGGYLRLQKSGRNYKALCPFHNEKTPSFMVSSERQIWHCFGGCNEGGDIFSFIMKVDGVEFPDALKILAQRAGIILKKQDPQLRTQRQRLYQICEWAAKFFEKQLAASQAGQKMLEYLQERGMQIETIKNWRLGYAPESWHSLEEFLLNKGYQYNEICQAGLIIKKETKNGYFDRFRDRVIFPIFDWNGQVIGFTARVNPFSKKTDTAKYINSPETPIYNKGRVLYGLDKAKLAIKKQNLCVVVEGNMDVIMSHQAGAENVIASSGTALTEEQLKIIKRYSDNLALAFDADLAGESATKKGIDLALKTGFNIKIIHLVAVGKNAAKKDPADLIQKNPVDWLKAIANAQGIIEFYFNSVLNRYDAKKVVDKKEIAHILLPIIKKISNKIEQWHWLQELARKINIKEEALIEQMRFLRELKIKFAAQINQKEKRNQILPGRRDQLEERLTGLLLTWPQKADWQKIKPNLLNEPYAAILKRVKKKQKLDSKWDEVKNRLVFKIENYPLEEKDVGQEINFCLRELKNQDIKIKLTKLENQIRECENNKNQSELEKLLEEFKNISSQLND